MRLDAFTLLGQEAITVAIELAERNDHQQVEPEHLLLAILEQPAGIAGSILTKLAVSVPVLINDIHASITRFPKVKGQQQYFSSRMTQIFAASQEQSTAINDEFISTESILLAIDDAKEGDAGKILRQHGVTHANLLKAIKEIRGKFRITDKNDEENYQALSKYAKNLTTLARQGQLDPVFCRDDEIRRIIQVLYRRTNNNPVLIGPPGVGKTAIVEGLAQRIVSGDVPYIFRDTHLLAINLSSMLAGAKYRNEFEDRLKAALERLEHSQSRTILLIDDLDILFTLPDNSTALNLLKPALSNSQVYFIGEVTTNAYKTYIESNEAVGLYFQPIFVEEPSIEDTLTILRGLKERFEVHHGVRIKDSAVIAAIELSHQHLKARHLPSKAIDLLDEAAAGLRVEIDTLPNDLDLLEREVVQLEINRLALAREMDENSQARLKDITIRLADMRARASEEKAKWREAKDLSDRLHLTRTEIIRFKAEAEQYERMGAFSKVAELRFGKLITLQEQLEKDEALATNLQSIDSAREVGEEEIFKLVTKLCGMPISKLQDDEPNRSI